MVEKKKDSSDEDSTDEEFDFNGLRRARVFLTDDETDEEHEPTEENDNHIVLELTPISSIDNTPEEEPMHHTEPVNTLFGNRIAGMERESSIVIGYRPNRLSAIRKLILTRGYTETPAEEGNSDAASNYARRLQQIRQRILSARNSDVAVNTSSSNTEMSAPAPSSHQPNPSPSPLLIRRNPAQLDFSLSNRLRQWQSGDS